MKVKKEDRQRVFDAYKIGVSLGQTMQEIAVELNKELGLDCEKTTYFKIYSSLLSDEQTRSELTEDFLDRKIQQATNLEVEQLKTRAMLIRQRAVVQQLAREVADKELAALAIAEVLKSYGVGDIANYIHDDSVVAPKIITRLNGYPIYAFSDVHWGYTENKHGVYYNTAVAKARLDYMFDWIFTDIIENKYAEVDIADLADDIEGAGLRPSQLLTIVESMTEQAIQYAEYIIQKLIMLSNMLPHTKINFRHISSDNHAELRLHGTKRGELPESFQPVITNQINIFVRTAHSAARYLNITYTTADEIILPVGKMNLLFAHGDQYGKTEDILNKTTQRHGMFIHSYIGGHWHQFSVKNRHRLNGVQETLIFLPAVVGDTLYARRSFYSGVPGFIKMKVNGNEGYMNAEQVPFLL